MKAKLKQLWKRLQCLAKGHPCKRTGRHAILLVERKCQNCGGTFISHAHFGNALMDADSESDQLFIDTMLLIEAEKVKPSALRES